MENCNWASMYLYKRFELQPRLGFKQCKFRQNTLVETALIKLQGVQFKKE